jgi:signal peptidase I
MADITEASDKIESKTDKDNAKAASKNVAPRDDKHHEKESLGDIIKTVLGALAIALLLRIIVFQPFSIPSESMRPGLLVGDYLFVSKWDYGISRFSIPFEPKLFKGRILNKQVERGDVVVFKHPYQTKVDYIKRVIGLPGDRIQVVGGQLVINGVPITREALNPEIIVDSRNNTISTNRWKETLPNGKTYITYDFFEAGQFDNTKVYEVPTGHYFMMGDNRDNSLDSRADPILEQGVGFVPEENIVGKARIVLFSWDSGVSLFKPWTWFTDLRYDRIAVPIK